MDLRGHLLISGGGLYDPNFRQTVVLLGEHTSEGAVGVVLNRALDVAVASAVPELSGYVEEGARLFHGGPVQPTSVVLVAELVDPSKIDLPVFGAIGFMVGELDPPDDLEIAQARVYAGYSGWGPGQLEREIAEGAWIIEPASVPDVFSDDPQGLWGQLLARKGGRYARLAKMPFDPSMN